MDRLFREFEKEIRIMQRVEKIIVLNAIRYKNDDLSRPHFLNGITSYVNSYIRYTKLINLIHYDRLESLSSCSSDRRNLLLSKTAQIIKKVKSFSLAFLSTFLK
jgi:hypothetical protein